MFTVGLTKTIVTLHPFTHHRQGLTVIPREIAEISEEEVELQVVIKGLERFGALVQKKSSNEKKKRDLDYYKQKELTAEF